MGRRKVPKFKGAFYHVLSRGNNKNVIFKDDGDYSKYLECLKNTQERYPYKLFAYSLIPNHSHLLLETHEELINKIMHSINTRYAQYFNRKYDKVGHVFQGRYKAILVQRGRYFLKLLGYIHLNPVRANLVEKPEEYPWSSHRFYAGLETSPFMFESEGLKLLDKNKNKAIIKYKNLINISLKEDLGFDFRNLEKFPIIGDPTYIEKVLMEEEIRRRKIIKIRLEKHTLLDFISKKLSINYDDVISISQDKKGSFCRNIFIYIGREYCGYSFVELGKFLNRSIKCISINLQRFKNKLKKNRDIQIFIDDVLQKIEINKK